MCNIPGHEITDISLIQNKHLLIFIEITQQKLSHPKLIVVVKCEPHSDNVKRVMESIFPHHARIDYFGCFAPKYFFMAQHI